MATITRPADAIAGRRASFRNGAAMAAFLASGVGSLAMGLIVVLNEAGVVAVPAVYAPAGGVSGRTTLALVVWLVAWGVLHSRWKARDVDASRILAVTLFLVVLGLLGTFPPIWQVL